VFDLKRSQEWAQSCLCRLTFELSGPRRQSALAARCMIDLSTSRPRCFAVEGPLERRVRPHCCDLLTRCPETQADKPADWRGTASPWPMKLGWPGTSTGYQ
jgi:hypothetical protein